MKEFLGMTFVIFLALFLLIENWRGWPQFRKSSYEKYEDKLAWVMIAPANVFASETHWLGLRAHGFRMVPMWHMVMKSDYPQIQIKDYGNSLHEYLINTNTKYIIADDEMMKFPSSKEETAKEIDKYWTEAGRVTDSFYGSSEFNFKRSPKPLTTVIYERRT